MRKTYSLVLMAAALLIGTQAKAAIYAPADADEFASNWGDLANGDKMIISENISFSRGVTAEFTVPAGASIEMEFQDGAVLNLGDYRLVVNDGELSLTGKGMIKNQRGNSCVFKVNGSTVDAPDYSTLNIGEGIKVVNEAQDGWGILVWGAVADGSKAFGAVVNIDGQVMGGGGAITINGNVNTKVGTNFPKININATAVVKGTNTVGPDAHGSYNCAVYCAGYGVWNIKGYVEGATGIYVKAGKVELDGAKVIATGERHDAENYGNGNTGSGDAVVFDTNNSYAGGTELVVKGNTSISSEQGYAIEEVITNGTSTEVVKVNIESGEFEGEMAGIHTSGDLKDKLHGELTDYSITGGSFSNDADNIKEYLKEDVAKAAVIEDGKVIVGKKESEFIEREGLSVGKFGTICYEYGSKNYAGATFFQIESFDESEIVLVEVAELFAGMPYIFEASAAKIMIEEQGEPKDYTLFAPYLVGSFDQTLVPAGKHVISNNKAMLCGENCSIEAHRAYIDLSALAAPAPARVGGKRYMMSINNEATELEVAEAVKAGRPVFMHNGKLFIMKDKAMYHVSGAQMR